MYFSLKSLCSPKYLIILSSKMCSSPYSHLQKNKLEAEQESFQFIPSSAYMLTIFCERFIFSTNGYFTSRLYWRQIVIQNCVYYFISYIVVCMVIAYCNSYHLHLPLYFYNIFSITFGVFNLQYLFLFPIKNNCGINPHYGLYYCYITLKQKK